MPCLRFNCLQNDADVKLVPGLVDFRQDYQFSAIKRWHFSIFCRPLNWLLSGFKVKDIKVHNYEVDNIGVKLQLYANLHIVLRA